VLCEAQNRHVARTDEKRNAYKILVGKPEAKRPLGRPSSRWEGNIRMNLREIGWKVWSGCIWLRTEQWRGDVNTVMNLQVIQKAENFLTS
jgi:hypothetical protein